MTSQVNRISNPKKLDEVSHYKKKLKPSLKILDYLVLTDVDEWSRLNLWLTKRPLYLLEDKTKTHCIVLDLKLMQNLARIFDDIIKKELSK